MIEEITCPRGFKNTETCLLVEMCIVGATANLETKGEATSRSAQVTCARSILNKIPNKKE